MLQPMDLPRRITQQIQLEKTFQPILEMEENSSSQIPSQRSNVGQDVLDDKAKRKDSKEIQNLREAFNLGDQSSIIQYSSNPSALKSQLRRDMTQKRNKFKGIKNELEILCNESFLEIIDDANIDFNRRATIMS